MFRFDLKNIALQSAKGAAYRVGSDVLALSEALARGLVRLPYPNLRVLEQADLAEGAFAFGSEPSRFALGDILLKDGTTQEELLLPHCLIGLSVQKNIVRTALAGKDKAVIEIISIENYEISIRGFLMGEEEFPEEGLLALKRFFYANRALGVENDYLRMWDIHNIVIKSLKIPEAAGMVNVLPFELSACDDVPIEIEMSNA